MQIHDAVVLLNVIAAVIYAFKDKFDAATYFMLWAIFLEMM